MIRRLWYKIWGQEKDNYQPTHEEFLENVEKEGNERAWKKLQPLLKKYEKLQ